MSVLLFIQYVELNLFLAQRIILKRVLIKNHPSAKIKSSNTKKKLVWRTANTKVSRNSVVSLSDTPNVPNKFKFDNKGLHNSLSRDLITTSHFSLYKISAGVLSEEGRFEKGTRGEICDTLFWFCWLVRYAIPPEGSEGYWKFFYLRNMFLGLFSWP